MPGARKGVLLGGAAVLALGAAGAAAFTLVDRGSPGTAASSPVPATVEVAKQDLIDTKTVDGKLTYDRERNVSPGASGTVTWVPGEGSEIRRGRPLLKVDREPVTLMYGKVPLYRPLSQGISDGPDVKQLERNLKKLGYGDDMTVDDDFTYATYLAVLEWQEDAGLPETGRVDASQVVFLPGKARVTDAKVSVGDKASPGQAALTVTGLRQLVEVDLDANDQELAKKGATVTVELPGGERVKGKITSVGTVAKTGGGEDDQESEPTIDVEISLNKDPKTRLDQAPVEVELVSERQKDVLAVPVEALLALREGGYGVEVVEGSKSHVVPVEVGAFGSGMVEITGGGLAEGMKVGVPES